ncbi:MAG: hypothetical protein QXY05_01840 [Candidatus Anstonellales archaeon]
MGCVLARALERLERIKPGNPDIHPKQAFSTAGPNHCDELKERSMNELERVWLPKWLMELYGERARRFGLPMRREILNRLHSLSEGEMEEVLNDGRTPKERVKILFEETSLDGYCEWKNIPRVDGRVEIPGRRAFIYFINETEYLGVPSIHILPERGEDLRKMPENIRSYDIGMAFAYWKVRDGVVLLDVVQSNVYPHIPSGIRKHYRHWPDVIFWIAGVLAKELNENYVGVVPAYLPLETWPRLSVSVAHWVYSYKPSKYFELEWSMWIAKADDILAKLKSV